MRHKIRLIFKPFLWIAAGVMLVYTLLDWWLVIRLGLIPWKEYVVHILLPFALAWIPLLIWLRPRVRLLAYPSRQDASGPLFVAALAIAAPTILLQYYLETSCGKLTNLITISQIGTTSPTKYYQVQHYFAQKELAKWYRLTTTSSRGNNMTYSLYIATPLLDAQTIVIKDFKPTKIGPKPIGHANTVVQSIALPDSLEEKPTPAVTDTSSSLDPGQASLTIGPVKTGPSQAWACVRYVSKGLSRSRSQEEKKQIWDDFFQASMTNFNHMDLNHAVYLDRIGNTEDRDYYEKAAEQSFLYSTSSAPITILEPRYEPFAARNGHKLEWAILAFFLGGWLFFLVLHMYDLDQSKLKAIGYEVDGQ